MIQQLHSLVFTQMNWKLTSTTKTYTCTFMVTLFIITKFESHKIVFWYQFSSVQSLSCVWLFATPWTATHHTSLSITNSQSLLKLMSIESVMLSNHLILCHPLLLLPSTFPSISFYQWVSSSHQVAKVLELQHQPFQWISRTDFLQNCLVGSPCSPRDFQEFSSTPIV